MTDTITLPRAHLVAIEKALSHSRPMPKFADEERDHDAALNEVRARLAQPQAESAQPSLEADGPQFDAYFDKHVDTLAEKHPSLLVRQLSRRLRDLKAQPATQPDEFSCPLCYDDPANIKQPTTPTGEPVAWMHEWEDGERIAMLERIDNRDNDPPKSVRPLVYGDTTPQPRKPLSDELIRSMCKETWVFETVKQWVRAIEAAHGIGGQA